MVWYQRYKQGIIATALAAGILGTFGVGTIVECNSKPKVLKNMRSEKQKRKNSMANKTLGVVVDSSISEVSQDNLKNALNDVLKTYKNQFGINYHVEFTYVNIKKNKLTEEDILSHIPKSYNNKNLRMVFTDGIVPSYASEDGTRAIGFAIAPIKLVVIPEIDRRCVDTLYNIVAHELGHINGYHTHHPDQNCMMYYQIDTDMPERKKFCPETIETILNQK